MTLVLGRIDITSLIDAHNEFKETLFHATKQGETYPKKFKQASVIQCFEFSYELAWKTMKRILHEKGIDVNSPKQTFREAAKEGFIVNPEVWFKFHEHRNQTVHTYDQEVVEDIFEVIPQFLEELTLFIQMIQKL